MPAAVRAALSYRLDGKALSGLAANHAALSDSYRRGANSVERLKTNDDALAYAVARMPATYAAVVYAIEQLEAAMPAFAPASMLDAGCGPGTAAIAAATALPSVNALTLIDRNAPLLALAHDLVPAAAPSAFIDIQSLALDPVPALPGVDLVVAAYVLVELPEVAVAPLVAALWRVSRQALLLVEPGTPEGFRRLRSVREQLIAAGGHLAAPCTHAMTCPMGAGDWCRVPVRVERSREHRALKGGALGHEDEPVAYLAVTREPPTARAEHRIVGQPHSTKVELALRACGAGTLANIRVPTREREKHKRFNKLRWGDTIPNQISDD